MSNDSRDLNNTEHKPTSVDFGDICSISTAIEQCAESVLEFGPASGLNDSPMRFERLRHFIVRVLLHIGLSPLGNAMAVIARLIEVMSTHPEIPLDEVIADFAATHFAKKDAVSRIIDKHLSVYNSDVYSRVTALTESSPQTAKDMLCDIAVYVRLKYYLKMLQ